MINTAANYTSFPTIFANAAWGSLPIKPNPAILKIRNTFVTHYKIKNLLSIPESLNVHKNYLFEHVECYSTEDSGRVIVLSPAVVTDSKIADAKKLGFKTCSGLWFANIKSFIITFDTVKAYNTFIKQVAD